MELTRFRSPRRLATTVATIVPATTAHRVRGPKAMSAPAATPAAGQNTATPSGVSRERLNLAEVIWMPPATRGSQLKLIHPQAGSAERGLHTPSFCNISALEESFLRG